MPKIKALIVDDEPLAREGIKQLLLREKDIQLIGESGDGFTAIELVKKHFPDLIFLDIELPEMDGFEILQELPLDHNPAIIFITAFNEYAVEAFNVHALDYLLKPIDPERFKNAIERARNNLRLHATSEINEKFYDLIMSLKSREEPARRLLIKTAKRIFFVEMKEIDWVQAAGDYVWVHTRGEKYLIRQTMNDMDHSLDPATFIRIHRSTIVNIDRIKELQPLYRGDYAVVLHNGVKLTMGRTYREKVLSILNK
ncbi:MAG: LytR/AlgR family response regulator transcription factor [Bacteroidota bacterium]